MSHTVRSVFRNVSFTLPMLAIAVSCQPRKFNQADPQEAMDEHNDPSEMQVNRHLTWDDVKEPKTASIDFPWTDTYWPLYEKGMAFRWAFPDGFEGANPKDGDVKQPETMTTQINSMYRAWEQKDTNMLAILSPGEKYELVKSRGKPLLKDVVEALAAHETAYQDVMKEKPELEKIRDKIDELQSKVYEIYSRMRGQRYRIVEALRDIARLNAHLASRDPRIDRQEVQKRIQKARSVIDWEIKLYRKDATAYDEINAEVETLYKTSQEMYEKLEKNGKDFAKKVASLGKQMEEIFPMVGSGWHQWGYYTNVMEESWSWMGHCHGWAAAALYEKTPAHAVLAKVDGREILFTEGDIRGLLTKVWAEQSPRRESLFVSQRCNSSELKFDERGRVLDPACRDTNPATLHLTLVDLIRNKKQGFVMDKTRSAQVWNQPVFKYSFEYLPLITKDGQVVEGGTPVPVSDLNDAFAKHRAAGTAYLVQVAATVSYGVEHGPSIDYADDADKNAVGYDMYIYTLELAADKKIIGGEWGAFQDSTKPVEDYYDDMVQMEAPDFLWGIVKGNKPHSKGIDYTVINKIHECSLDTSGLQTRQVHPEVGVSVKYKECVL